MHHQPRITWLSNKLLFGLVRVNASPAEWARVMSLQMQVATRSSKNEWKFFRWAGESIKCNGSRIHVFLMHSAWNFLFTRIDSERVNDITSLRETPWIRCISLTFFYIHRWEPGTDDVTSNQLDGKNAHRQATPKIKKTFRDENVLPVYTSFFYLMLLCFVFISNPVRIYRQNFFRETSIKITNGEYQKLRSSCFVRYWKDLGDRAPQKKLLVFCSSYLGVNILLMRMNFGADDYEFASLKLSVRNERTTKAAISYIFFSVQRILLFEASSSWWMDRVASASFTSENRETTLFGEMVALWLCVRCVFNSPSSNHIYSITHQVKGTNCAGKEGKTSKKSLLNIKFSHSFESTCKITPQRHTTQREQGIYQTKGKWDTMKWLTASKTCIDIDKFIVRRRIARRTQQRRSIIDYGSSNVCAYAHIRSGSRTCTHPTLSCVLLSNFGRSVSVGRSVGRTVTNKIEK